MSKQFRTAYSERYKVSLSFPDDEGRTKQSHKNECDINKIIRDYDRSGVLTHVREMEAKFGNMTGMEFHEAMCIVADAKSNFEQLPSSIRNRFENDPGKFMDFIHDPDQAEEIVKMGLGQLIEKEPEPETPPVTAKPAEPPAE